MRVVESNMVTELKVGGARVGYTSQGFSQLERIKCNGRHVQHDVLLNAGF